MGIYNMYGRQLQYHCNKILGSVHNGLSTKAEGLLTKVRATTRFLEWNLASYAAGLKCWRVSWQIKPGPSASLSLRTFNFPGSLCGGLFAKNFGLKKGTRIPRKLLLQQPYRSHVHVKTSRNVVNILLFVAEQCKRYYPATEIPNMLETFLPLLTKEVLFYETFKNSHCVLTSNSFLRPFWPWSLF